MTLLTPHGDKLVALLRNDKLPETDRARIEEAFARYRSGLTLFREYTPAVAA
jgi:hypothetical protein